MRTYPYNTLGSDLIGFTASGNVGNGGIEASYNDILNGTDGREYGYLDETCFCGEDCERSNRRENACNFNRSESPEHIVEKYIKEFNDAHKTIEEDPRFLAVKTLLLLQ